MDNQSNVQEYQTDLCSLSQFAKRKITFKGKKYNLDIPAFQRGLVWNPAQVEILWDSVLRGIPLGCITLVRYHDDNETLGVFDGQQRINALSTGIINNPFKKQTNVENTSDSILWIDLFPNKSKSTTRKFFLYLTTSGQPWGYKINDSNTEAGIERLNTSERQAALEKAGKKQVSFGKPQPKEMWPYMANCPVPFAFLWETEGEQADDFRNNLTSILRQCEGQPWYDLKVKDKLQQIEKEDFGELSHAIYRAKAAKIVSVISPVSFKKEGEIEQETQQDSEVAVFFSRLNRGGTMPPMEELNYSILKSIVPCVAEMDKYAKGRMQPARFATIAMRLHMTEKTERWQGSFSRQDAYELVSQQKEIAMFIDKLPQRIEILEKNLLYNSKDNPDGLPKYLLSKLVSKQPDLYLFFLLLTKSYQGELEKKRGFLISLFMLLSIFGENVSYKNAYEVVYSSTESSLDERIKSWIFTAILKNQILIPPPPKAYDGIVEAVKNTEACDINLLEKRWNPPLYKSSLDRIWGWTNDAARYFLLYSLRAYIDEKFKGYDPASAVWSEDNCPWDYDHIFPQNLLRSGRGNRKGPFHKIANEFINCIGNIAPLPFSVNRRKSDSLPYQGDEYFSGHDASLMTELNEITKKSVNNLLIDSKDIDYKGEKTFNIGCYVVHRLRDMYTDCYQTLKWGELSNFKEQHNLRNTIFEQFTELFSPFANQTPISVWAIAHDGTQKPIADHDWDWARTWLACGLPVESTGGSRKALVCICSDGNSLEWGLRRHPDASDVEGNPNAWWLPTSGENITWGREYCKTCSISEGKERMGAVIEDIKSVYQSLQKQD